jgi:hypothetical protein
MLRQILHRSCTVRPTTRLLSKTAVPAAATVTPNGLWTTVCAAAAAAATVATVTTATIYTNYGSNPNDKESCKLLRREGQENGVSRVVCLCLKRRIRHDHQHAPSLTHSFVSHKSLSVAREMPWEQLLVTTELAAGCQYCAVRVIVHLYAYW